MELKAVYKYEKPECPTIEENKNRILLMMVRTGKISLGVTVMCLLCNYSFATPATSIYDIHPELRVREQFFNTLGVISSLGIIISLVVTIILYVIKYKKYKNCEDRRTKERLRKSKNIILIIGVVACILFVAIYFWIDYRTAIRIYDQNGVLMGVSHFHFTSLFNVF